MLYKLFSTHSVERGLGGEGGWGGQEMAGHRRLATESPQTTAGDTPVAGPPQLGRPPCTSEAPRGPRRGLQLFIRPPHGAWSFPLSRDCQ